jgi:CRISPR-associated protein (TIGR03986 family)
MVEGVEIMARGTIKELYRQKSFGFIQPDDGGDDIWFNASRVKKPILFDQLVKGMTVEYEAEPSERGGWRATFVRAIYRFLNPYNFVRFLKEGRATDVPTMLLGRCAPPPYDRYLGITGKIICTLKNTTPLFISDSEFRRELREHKSYRFFHVNGRQAIPATSLRGIVRSVFEATTNSCMTLFQLDQRDGDDYPLEYRGSNAPNLTPARVVELNDTGAMLEVLDCSQNLPLGVRFVAPPALIKCGILLAYPDRVLYCQHGQVVTFDPSRSKLPANSYDGMRVAAVVNLQPIFKPSNAPPRRARYQYLQIIKAVPASQHSTLTVGIGQKLIFGYLHLTGPNIENKHDERIFFDWNDNTPVPPSTLPKVTASFAVVTEYNQRLQDYWERNEQQVRKLGNKPWPIDARSLPHPSTFIRPNSKLTGGDLVYFELDSSGNVSLLRPVTMPRVPYKQTRQALLPKHLVSCDHFNQQVKGIKNLSLCPACRVFGWVKQQTSTDPDATVAYAGRVRFSDGVLRGEAKKMSRAIPLAILSSPKPTTSAFYLLNERAQPDFYDATYNMPNAQLRGRKFYRHHRTANPQEYERARDEQHDGKDGQNRTVEDVLDVGNEFCFTVNFENLAPVELGALLWALEIDGWHHRLGFAKPLGFGSIQIKVEDVEVLDPGERYVSLNSSGWQSVERENWQERCVKIFKAAMERRYRTQSEEIPFEELDTIQDLHALLTDPPNNLPVHYPRSTLLPTVDGENFKWFVGNKRPQTRISGGGPHKPLPIAAQERDDEGLPLIDEKGGRS